jgi:hypothetical protein
MIVPAQCSVRTARSSRCRCCEGRRESGSVRVWAGSEAWLLRVADHSDRSAVTGST